MTASHDDGERFLDPLDPDEAREILHNGVEVEKALQEQRWRDNLIMTGGKKGKKNFGARPCLENAIVALREAPEFRGALRFNTFSLRTVTEGFDLWPELAGNEWTNIHDIACAAWLQRHGIMVSRDIAGQAAERVAHEHRFHPVLDYLDRCIWDGVSRLDLWLVTYLGAEDTPYARAVGAKWLISAVARIYQPGCKADCMLILEGEQGTLKSTALKTLGGAWFADELGEMGSKDAALQLSGKWIIEVSELDALHRGSGISRTKAFISRTSDWYRPPYERRAVDQPRQCVFAGTVNHSEYLRDETGARRFWPIVCRAIDVKGLEGDRDQLWAEARERYLENECWWLDTVELIEDATEQQSARFQLDAWDDQIGEYIYNKEKVTVGDILKEQLFITSDKWTQPDQNRVARCLRHRGWKRTNVYDPETRKATWHYVRPLR